MNYSLSLSQLAKQSASRSIRRKRNWAGWQFLLLLVQELCFELLDVVDVLFDLDDYFCFYLPGLAPRLTFSDLVD